MDKVRKWHFLSTSNKGICSTKIKFHAGVKKCHFGNFSEWAEMAVIHLDKHLDRTGDIFLIKSLNGTFKLQIKAFGPKRIFNFI